MKRILKPAIKVSNEGGLERTVDYLRIRKLSIEGNYTSLNQVVEFRMQGAVDGNSVEIDIFQDGWFGFKPRVMRYSVTMKKMPGINAEFYEKMLEFENHSGRIESGRIYAEQGGEFFDEETDSTLKSTEILFARSDSGYGTLVNVS